MEQICKSCGASNRIGELLCRECGDLLVLPDPSKTAKLRLENYVAGALIDTPVLLRMEIAGKNREMPLQDGSTVLIGRGIGALRGEAVIDFADLQAVEKGISREHAVIYVEGASVFLVDLESTNGTYLNGRLLRPHQPNILRDGDTVLFGRLETRIGLS